MRQTAQNNGLVLLPKTEGLNGALALTVDGYQEEISSTN